MALLANNIIMACPNSYCVKNMAIIIIVPIMKKQWRHERVHADNPSVYDQQHSMPNVTNLSMVLCPQAQPNPNPWHVRQAAWGPHPTKP